MLYMFEDFELDTERYELRCAGEARTVEPQIFDILAYLVKHRDRVVSKQELLDEIWPEGFVTESTLTSRLMAARRAIGDSGGAQRMIKTIRRRGYRFVGEVSELDEAAAAAPDPPSAVERAAPVRFCTTQDGARIAYSVTGRGRPVVKVANWLTHLEFDFESPVWRHLITDLVPDRRLVRYDARGSGLSDWDVDEMSLEVWVRDLESIVDELSLERFPLFGISQGWAIAVAYAIRHAERVSHLVLHGAYARGRYLRGLEQREDLLAASTLARQGWGKPETAFARYFSNRMIPGGTAEQQRWLTDLQRVSTSAENAVWFMNATGEFNVVDLLRRLEVPTLVLHSRRDQQVPFEEGRLLAAEIPDARLIALESDNHLILEHEPAWSRFRDEIRAFLDAGPTP